MSRIRWWLPGLLALAYLAILLLGPWPASATAGLEYKIYVPMVSGDVVDFTAQPQPMPQPPPCHLQAEIITIGEKSIKARLYNTGLEPVYITAADLDNITSNYLQAITSATSQLQPLGEGVIYLPGSIWIEPLQLGAGAETSIKIDLQLPIIKRLPDQAITLWFFAGCMALAIQE